MNRFLIACTILIMMAFVSGCRFSTQLLTSKLEAGSIDRIQVVLAMGNPDYGADSKIITDRNEIEALVNAFNLADVGNKVPDVDLAVADASKYFLYSEGVLVQQFAFNGNDSDKIWYRSSWRYVTYPDRTPWEIYKASRAETIVVDENMVRMERPAK